MSRRAEIAEADEEVVLVDEHDRALGRGGKIDVHKRGALHRAFSIIIRDRAGRLLLQKRALGKYHSGGLWTNTCCGHPRPGEATEAAARRRLEEEMGFTCPLVLGGAIQYQAELDRGMIENEYVHVYLGRYDGPISPDPREAEDFAWHDMDHVRAAIAEAPESFSVWFKLYVAERWPVISGSVPSGEAALDTAS